MGEDKRENCRPAIELEALKKENDTTERRLNDHGERLKILENNGVRTAKDLESFGDAIIRLEKAIDKLSSIVENLKEKPGKRYEQIITTIITVTVSIAVTYFITKK